MLWNVLFKLGTVLYKSYNNQAAVSCSGDDVTSEFYHQITMNFEKKLEKRGAGMTVKF